MFLNGTNVLNVLENENHEKADTFCNICVCLVSFPMVKSHFRCNCNGSALYFPPKCCLRGKRTMTHKLTPVAVAVIERPLSLATF